MSMITHNGKKLMRSIYGINIKGTPNITVNNIKWELCIRLTKRKGNLCYLAKWQILQILVEWTAVGNKWLSKANIDWDV